MRCREQLGDESLPTVLHGECAIEMCADLDPSTCITTPTRAGAKLEKAAVELHGVVMLDGACVLEAADAIEVRRGGPPRGGGMRGGLSEPRIIAGEKPIEDALGLCERAGAG